MDTLNLPQLLDNINQQINFQETLDTQLQHALARVSAIADFDQLSPLVIHHYLWTLTEALEQAPYRLAICFLRNFAICQNQYKNIFRYSIDEDEPA